MSDKIRKYVLPCLPYLFAFWFFSKVGTAYRLAAGASFGEKLFGMVKTLSTAFQSYAPGLCVLDLLVGGFRGCGAVLRGAVQGQKSTEIQAGLGVWLCPLGNRKGH